MRNFLSLIMALFVFATTSVAFATKGQIVYCKNDYYIVIATNNGYTCGNIFGLAPWNLSRGDYVAGELESYGTHEIYDISIDDSFSLWIDEYWMNADRAMDWIERH